MASAAAVAADAARSPLPFQEQDDVLNTTGTITSADATIPDEIPAAEDDDDDDDDIGRPARRKAGAPMSNGVRDKDDEDLANGDQNADEELFGSEPDDPLSSPKPRLLDDEELDSGDDEGREDRLPDDEDALALDDGQQPQEELTFMDVEFGRHPIPEPSDGELYFMKVPRFLGVAPHAFEPGTFQPPSTDHHSKGPPSNSFSAYNTALTTIRWRRSPSNPSQLQSNTRLIRWSDGTLTLQIANDPQTQYSVHGAALAPPQVNPHKPTPTSIQYDRRKGKPRDTSYRVEKDTFTYLAAPNERAQILRITNKFTTSLKVDPAQNATTDALERLQAQLAAAAGGGMGDVESAGIGVVHITEDPELAKKKAEQAEKEKLRAQKRREMQEQRDRERGVGRSGLSRRGAGHGGGLTVGGLEDDEDTGRAGSGRLPGIGKKRKKPRPNRRGEIYSDEEEEYGRRNRTKEDEYDEEDDFVAPSDEEEEVADESDEDIDEGIDLHTTRRPQQRQGGAREPEEDAEGDVEDDGGAAASAATASTPVAAAAVDRGDAGSPVGRSAKRRRVIEEDEDEE